MKHAVKLPFVIVAAAALVFAALPSCQSTPERVLVSDEYLIALEGHGVELTPTLDWVRRGDPSRTEPVEFGRAGTGNGDSTLIINSRDNQIDGLAKFTPLEILESLTRSKAAAKTQLRVTREWTSQVNGVPTRFVEGSATVEGVESGLLCALLETSHKTVVAAAVLKGSQEQQDQAGTSAMRIIKSIRLEQVLGNAPVSAPSSTLSAGEIAVARNLLVEFGNNLKQGKLDNAASMLPSDWVERAGGLGVVTKSMAASQAKMLIHGFEVKSVHSHSKSKSNQTAISAVVIFSVEVHQQVAESKDKVVTHGWYAALKVDGGWAVLEGDHSMEQGFGAIKAMLLNPLRFPQRTKTIEDSTGQALVTLKEEAGEWVQTGS